MAHSARIPEMHSFDFSLEQTMEGRLDHVLMTEAA
jgi:hypothetical protein